MLYKLVESEIEALGCGPLKECFSLTRTSRDVVVGELELQILIRILQVHLLLVQSLLHKVLHLHIMSWIIAP